MKGKTADELFGEIYRSKERGLYYDEYYNFDHYIWYFIFDYDIEKLIIRQASWREGQEDVILTKQQLRAICAKCEELGWIDEQ